MSDSSIPDIQKLQYLLTSLHGSAQRLLAGTKIEAVNFGLAWEKLKRRYYDPGVRLYNYLEKLINTPVVSQRSAAEIGSLLDAAEEVRKGLQDLGHPVAGHDIRFIHFIVKKLDSQKRESCNIKNKSFDTRIVS